MKAFYKTVLRGETARVEYPFRERPDQVHEYKLLERTEPCCGEMAKALGEAIGFGEFHDYILNGDKEINFANCHPYPEGTSWNYYAIKFCPFCGEPVSTEERERVSLKKSTRVIPERTETTYEEVVL